MRLVKAHWLVCLATLLAFAPSSAQAEEQNTKNKPAKEPTKTEEPTVPVSKEPQVPVTKAPEVPVTKEPKVPVKEPEVPVVVEEPVIVEEPIIVEEPVIVAEPVVTVVEEVVLVLTCAEIGAILIADNTAVVTQAQLALLRAWNPLVSAYALQMVTEHSVLSAKIAALLSAQGVVPLENDISARVTAAGTADMAILTAAPPLTFDSVFMQQQIVAHERTLELIDVVLLPAAVDPTSRAFLIDARIDVANHLALALSISAGLL